MSYKPKVLNGLAGGTGVANADASTITLAGPLVTSGANSITLTSTGATNVTLPTSGTLATTSQLPSSPATVAQGGTGRTTLTNHGVLVGAATTAITQLAAGSAGQVLQSGGASADPAYSTATYPSTAGTSGNVLTSDGTNWTSAAANTGIKNSFLVSTVNGVLADGVTYFLQPSGGTASYTASGNAFTRFYVTAAGTINKCYGVVISPVLGTSEATTIAIRKNNTTDTNVTTTLNLSASPATFNNTSLNISVAAGDYIEFKIICPTYATNPTVNVSMTAVVE